MYGFDVTVYCDKKVPIPEIPQFKGIGPVADPVFNTDTEIVDTVSVW